MAEHQVRMKQFVSEVGNSIILPEDWEEDDRRALWIFTSADRLARFHIYTCTVEGTGTHKDFQAFMLSNLHENGDYQRHAEEPVDFAGHAGRRIKLEPSDDNDDDAIRYVLYTIEDGEYYHAITVEARNLIGKLNEGAFDEFVRSFRGITFED
jgi:hypothetical protein